MRPVNVPAGSQRNSNVGLLYKEVYNGAAGITLQLLPQSTIRVSAGANVTVTVGGVLAMTLRNGEVEHINVGMGEANNTRTKVEVVIGAGDVRVQVAEDSDYNSRFNR